MRKVGIDCNISYGLLKFYEAKGDDGFDTKLAAVTEKSAAEYGNQKLSNDYLYDFEVPDDVKDLREMIYFDGERMVEWMRDAKRRSGLPPSKTELKAVEDVEAVTKRASKDVKAEVVQDGGFDRVSGFVMGAALAVCMWCL